MIPAEQLPTSAENPTSGMPPGSLKLGSNPKNLIQNTRRYAVEALRGNVEALKQIKNNISDFDPRTLSKAPLIDEEGRPVHLRFPDEDNIQVQSSESFDPIPDELTNRIKNETREWVNDYTAKMDWQYKAFYVRPVKKSDVESYEKDMIGEEGVFAKEPIRKGTVVAIFGGMIFMQNPEEWAKLENILGPDSGKHNIVVAASPSNEEITANRYTQVEIIGHSLAKKFNTRFKKSVSKYTRDIFSRDNFDSKKNNVNPYIVTLERVPTHGSDESDSSLSDREGQKSKAGMPVEVPELAPIPAAEEQPARSQGGDSTKQMEILFFYANRDIAKDEQICFKYGSPRFIMNQMRGLTSRIKRTVSQVTMRSSEEAKPDREGWRKSVKKLTRLVRGRSEESSSGGADLRQGITPPSREEDSTRATSR
jgi:hypothetical protein